MSLCNAAYSSQQPHLTASCATSTPPSLQAQGAYVHLQFQSVSMDCVLFVASAMTSLSNVSAASRRLRTSAQPASSFLMWNAKCDVSGTLTFQRVDGQLGTYVLTLQCEVHVLLLLVRRLASIKLRFELVLQTNSCEMC